MEEAAALAADRGDAFAVLMSRMFLGLSRVKLGRISDGLREFQEGISLARRNGDRFWLPRLVSFMGWGHREVLAHDKAREFDTEALRLVREASLPQGPETEVLLYLASDEMRLGNVDRASALLAELEAKVAESNWFRWMDAMRLAAVSAEYWTACGEPNRAIEHASRLRGLARRLGARDYLCAAERWRAEAALVQGGDLELAAQDLNQALDGLREHPALHETWKSARLLGRLHLRLGNEVAAGRAFAEAAEAIHTIAAGVTDEGLREGFLNAAPVREVLDAAPEA